MKNEVTHCDLGWGGCRAGHPGKVSDDMKFGDQWVVQRSWERARGREEWEDGPGVSNPECLT